MQHFSLDFGREHFLILRNFLESLLVQTKYETRARAAASGVIVFGIGLVLIYVHTWRALREKYNRHVFTRSMSIGALHGGKLAMKRLLQYHKIRAAQKNEHDNYLEKLKKMINTNSPDFPRLQGILAKMEMRGQEDVAIEILKEAAKEAKDKSLPQHEYEYQMLLVEALIYKGDLKEAKMASCLNNDDTSDVRRSLYKAIILELMNKSEKAEEEWEEFKKIRSQFLLPPDIKDSHFYELLTNFEKFKQVVKLLKNDIEEKKKKKAK